MHTGVFEIVLAMVIQLTLSWLEKVHPVLHGVCCHLCCTVRSSTCWAIMSATAVIAQ
jgi:hypothetical protein